MDAEGCRLFSGLIDLHTNGVAGYDVSDGGPEGIRRNAKYHVPIGVTTFCATTMTLPEDTLTAAVQWIRAYR